MGGVGVDDVPAAKATMTEEDDMRIKTSALKKAVSSVTGATGKTGSGKIN